MTSLPNPQTLRSVTSTRGDRDEPSRSTGFRSTWAWQTVRWGGVWGAALAPLLSRWRGGAYWAGWIIVAAIALPLVAFFVVPPIKGEPVPELWPRFLISMMVNGAWGFGTALFLRLTSAARSD